jgi:hypothetical protein
MKRPNMTPMANAITKKSMATAVDAEYVASTGVPFCCCCFGCSLSYLLSASISSKSTSVNVKKSSLASVWFGGGGMKGTDVGIDDEIDRLTGAVVGVSTVVGESASKSFVIVLDGLDIDETGDID